MKWYMANGMAARKRLDGSESRVLRRRELSGPEEELVDTLRTDRFKQARELLARSGKQRCCLGVACGLSGMGKWRPVTRLPVAIRYEYACDGGMVYFLSAGLGGHSSTLLPGAVRDSLGWLCEDGEIALTDRDQVRLSLVALNDGGLTFSQIADVIEAGLVLTQAEG